MRKKEGYLLLDQDRCLVMQPLVAERFGRTNALILQQIHYWLSAKESIGILHENKRWVYNTYAEWAKEINKISESTIKRAVAFFKKIGVLLIKSLHKNKAVRTNFYTIDYAKLETLLGSMEKTPQALSLTEPLSHEVKMTRPSAQNDPMYIETKITSKNLQTSSEQVRVEKSNIEKREGEKPLALDLLDIWNEEVGNLNGQIAALTKERARFLVSAFHAKFNASVETWREFCKKLTQSDFLMGRIKATFKATLDWVLKFETLQKLFEGQYGVSAINSIPETVLLNDPQDSPEIRKTLRERVGEGAYLSWFTQALIHQEAEAVTLTFPTKFQADYVERMYQRELEKGFQGRSLDITVCTL